MRHPLIVGASAALVLAGCVLVVKAPSPPPHARHAPAAEPAASTAAAAASPAALQVGAQVAAQASPAVPSAAVDEPILVPPKAPSAAASRAMLAAALEWLAANQREDGSWDDGAGANQLGGGSAAARDEGPRPHAVGVTALCTLALSRAPEPSEHRAAAERGLAWLRAQQDDETGLIGSRKTHDFMYGHGIATLALAELLTDDSPASERVSVQNAVNMIVRARNPYAAWRYEVPPVGDNDTSVTGWMLAALDAARRKGIRFDDAALQGGLTWIDEVTDPRTGRIGYDSFGSLSSRTPANEQFPRDRGEAMTAVGLASRVELQGAETRRDLLASHARLLKRNLPVWDPRSGGVDMYYWFHGTRGMHALGGADWEVWRASLLAAAVEGQSHVASYAGSWDPVGPWGYSGGRAYATALMALSVAECLE